MAYQQAYVTGILKVFSPMCVYPTLLCVCCTLRLTGLSPFLGDNDMETIQSISSGEFDYPDPDPDEGYEDISDLAKEFIDSLLVQTPGWDSKGWSGGVDGVANHPLLSTPPHYSLIIGLDL